MIIHVSTEVLTTGLAILSENENFISSGIEFCIYGRRAVYRYAPPMIANIGYQYVFSSMDMSISMSVRDPYNRVQLGTGVSFIHLFFIFLYHFSLFLVLFSHNDLYIWTTEYFSLFFYFLLFGTLCCLFSFAHYTPFRPLYMVKGQTKKLSSWETTVLVFLSTCSFIWTKLTSYIYFFVRKKRSKQYSLTLLSCYIDDNH